MHGSKLPPLAAPPISITCIACRNEMRLASIDPTDEKAVYTYECANGHQRKISTADPTSVRGGADGATNSRNGATGAPGNLQRRAEHFAAINRGSERLARNLCAACVAAPVVNDRFGGFWKSGSTWAKHRDAGYHDIGIDFTLARDRCHLR
jgi:hypothetical protein